MHLLKLDVAHLKNSQDSYKYCFVILAMNTLLVDLVLHIYTNKQVLFRPFAGRNHIFLIFARPAPPPKKLLQFASATLLNLNCTPKIEKKNRLGRNSTSHTQT